ncbi:MAG: hypothetical protein ACK2U2_20125 [Anaerolineae bacterium]|jgi:hypothetical protein
MQTRTVVKPDRTVEAGAWPAGTEDSLLVAAVAAALVEYRRHIAQASGHDSPAPARSNWRIVTRVSQLGHLR